MRLRHPYPRRAATIVEFAVVGPVTLLLLLGLVIGGLGIFRYQQVAHLAREASRWAAVHGADYARETGNAAATPSSVYSQSISPNAVGLDFSRLTCSVVGHDGQPLSNTNNGTAHTATVSGKDVSITNAVTVTVTYQWIPEAFLGSPKRSSVESTSAARQCA
jgi:Flp pilus assembly protein TadG